MDTMDMIWAFFGGFVKSGMIYNGAGGVDWP